MSKRSNKYRRRFFPDYIQSWLRVIKCCSYCGTMNASEWTVEHVVPRSLNGYKGIRNVVIVCADCNDMRGSQTLKNFRRKIQGFWIEKVGIALLDDENISEPIRWLNPSIREILFIDFLKVGNWKQKALSTWENEGGSIIEE